MAAASNGHYAVVKELIHLGSDVNTLEKKVFCRLLMFT